MLILLRGIEALLKQTILSRVVIAQKRFQETGLALILAHNRGRQRSLSRANDTEICTLRLRRVPQRRSTGIARLNSLSGSDYAARPVQAGATSGSGLSRRWAVTERTLQILPWSGWRVH